MEGIIPPTGFFRRQVPAKAVIYLFSDMKSVMKFRNMFTDPRNLPDGVLNIFFYYVADFIQYMACTLPSSHHSGGHPYSFSLKKKVLCQMYSVEDTQ